MLCLVSTYGALAVVQIAYFPSSMAVRDISGVQTRIHTLGNGGVPQPQTTTKTSRGATVHSPV